MSGESTRIATNVFGMQALNAMMNVNRKLQEHQLRLATGQRINSAADDPAGLTLATKLHARSEGLGQALSNISDSKNMLAIAEGGLNKINDILVRMQTKATQAANDSLGTSERDAIDQELQDLNSEIDAIVEETQFNNNALLDGSIEGAGSALNFQTGSEASETTAFYFAAGNGSFTSSDLSVEVGATVAALTEVGAPPTNATADDAAVFTTTTDVAELASGMYSIRLTSTVDGANKDYTVQLFDAAGDLVNIDTDGVDGGALGTTLSKGDILAGTTIDLGVGIDITLSATVAAGTYSWDVQYTHSGHSVSSNANATTFLTSVQGAIDDVSSSLQRLGSMVARLGIKEENVTTAKINTEAAYSRIMNADMAQEQLEATKYQILQQTATAMLGQANQGPQSILSLFR